MAVRSIPFAIRSRNLADAQVGTRLSVLLRSVGPLEHVAVRFKKHANAASAQYRGDGDRHWCFVRGCHSAHPAQGNAQLVTLFWSAVAGLALDRGQGSIVECR